jgi:hypothetical protein
MTDKANSPTRIGERQNDPAMLELLRADSWHYKRAKRWHLSRIVGTLVLAACAPVITFWLPSATDAVAVAVAVWVVAARTILNMAERREMRLGVSIQEQFDTELFGLEWNRSLAGRRPAPEDIADAARHVGDSALLRDWYAETGEAPWPLNVILCQRSSAVWGRRAHWAYGSTVLGIGCLWLLAGVVMALAAHLTLSDYLLKLFLPSQPAFLDTIDLYRTHLRQSRDKGDVEEAADSLWAKGVADGDAVAAADCRQLQDQSYRLRLNGPQIPQWFYRVRRGADEHAMRAAVAKLLSQLPATTAQEGQI